MRDVPSQILVFGHRLMYEYNPMMSAPACLVARAEVVSVDLVGIRHFPAHKNPTTGEVPGKRLSSTDPSLLNFTKHGSTRMN